MDAHLLDPQKVAGLEYVLFWRADGHLAVEKAHRITKWFTEILVSNGEYGRIETVDVISFHPTHDQAVTYRDYAVRIADIVERDLGLSAQEARRHYTVEDSWDGIARGKTPEELVDEYRAAVAVCDTGLR